MTKLLQQAYTLECRMFRTINRYFDYQWLNIYFRLVTHVGGATFSIVAVLLAMIFFEQEWRMTAVASACALAASHIPVAVMKRLYPRPRPYVVLSEAKVYGPLKDHSFPSGHTTAVFAIVIPFVFALPVLSFGLLPIAFSVAISRIYLGLHYPSDVLAGCLLGTAAGAFAFYLLL
ncbi:putative undecaprenyl-diphosphatase YbjG [Anoxybacillus sp. P3H1B]|jgi:undecaprenyl-diphosphatase|uniref:Phosphatase PAP2 family protein n=1 Tax=Anoxybacteroides rupiense TaxID=311460 RepID=A0ABD5IZL0_9BACL|nr:MULTISPECIES: phosphatase PAP2 family protein [Anoxybacillus]KXG08681.1 putative undecaprenyl-diphosphatase YbjG [Anoxybacillus sp. P3H1B]MBB3906481.1 undecaprenyl-diphosphatase [Anoxybacillus rupiensis]MED5053790.1 phosphatase PAP2 family protein [Anoxybacillus rupiensis]OQM44709.1 phosphatase PAP2 family protein [Anoxybacillus sp. UARK-01]